MRDTTWYADVQRLLEKYQVTAQVEEVLKSGWKKEVKEKIKKKIELEIKEKCADLMIIAPENALLEGHFGILFCRNF